MTEEEWNHLRARLAQKIGESILHGRSDGIKRTVDLTQLTADDHAYIEKDLREFFDPGRQAAITETHELSGPDSED